MVGIFDSHGFGHRFFLVFGFKPNFLYFSLLQWNDAEGQIHEECIS